MLCDVCYVFVVVSLFGCRCCFNIALNNTIPVVLLFCVCFYVHVVFPTRRCHYCGALWGGVGTTMTDPVEDEASSKSQKGRNKHSLGL